MCRHGQPTEYSINKIKKSKEAGLFKHSARYSKLVLRGEETKWFFTLGDYLRLHVKKTQNSPL